MKQIILSGNNLLEIVNGILDISKIESGKIEIVNKEYGANVYRHLANFKAKVNNILFSNMSFYYIIFKEVEQA